MGAVCKTVGSPQSVCMLGVEIMHRGSAQWPRLAA